MKDTERIKRDNLKRVVSNEDVAAVGRKRVQLDEDVIQEFLQAKAKQLKNAGLFVSASISGRLYRWSSAAEVFGPKPFQMGCITKMMVAAIALELESDGRLDIDGQIAKYIVELQGTPVGEGVLIRHLLSDTRGYVGVSSLSAVTRDVTWEDLVGSLLHDTRLFAPGTVCSLDYMNFVLIGKVIERVTGRHWTEIADEKICRALFGRSLYIDKDRRSLWSAAATRSTLAAHELVALGEVIMTGHSAMTGRLLSESTVSRLHEAVVHNPQMVGCWYTHWLPAGYGLGVPLYHSGLRGECGRARRELSSVRMHRSRRIVMAVCVESGDMFARHQVLDYLLDAVGIHAPERLEQVVMDVCLQDVAGSYIGLAGMNVTIGVERNRYCVRVSNAVRESKYFGNIESDGTVSIDSRQALAGIAFFRAPQSGIPSMMLGVHALRKA